MITVYLVSLVLGGGLLAASLFGGHGDSDADAAGHDGGGDHDASADHDAGHDHDHDAHLGDAAHGVRDAQRRGLWNPLLSFRFWTFGTAFFGLTGALLTWRDLAFEPIRGAVAAGAGLAIGLVAAAVTRVLRETISADEIRIDDYRGQLGELSLPLREGGTTRVRIRVRHREREVLARAEEPIALAAGARVVIVALDPDGRAVVTPAESLMPAETLLEPSEILANMEEKEPHA